MLHCFLRVLIDEFTAVVNGLTEEAVAFHRLVGCGVTPVMGVSGRGRPFLALHVSYRRGGRPPALVPGFGRTQWVSISPDNKTGFPC